MSIFSRQGLETELNYQQKRGDTYRARALALLVVCRSLRVEVRNQLTALKIGECRDVAEPLMERVAAEHARAVAAAAEAENAKLRRLLNDAGEHIEELHGMIEDELLTGQAIELDPVLNAIKAALTDYPAALSATPAGPASTVDGL